MNCRITQYIWQIPNCTCLCVDSPVIPEVYNISSDRLRQL